MPPPAPVPERRSSLWPGWSRHGLAGLLPVCRQSADQQQYCERAEKIEFHGYSSGWLRFRFCWAIQTLQVEREKIKPQVYSASLKAGKHCFPASLAASMRPISATVEARLDVKRYRASRSNLGRADLPAEFS